MEANSPEPYSARAISYLALQNVDDARDDINRALQLDGNRAEFWVTQGLVLEAAGESGKAYRAFSRGAQLDPKYQPARDGMSRTQSGAAGNTQA